jgi:hypothetical protein
MLQARSLLHDGRLSIGEVASAVGLSQNRFGIVFKRLPRHDTQQVQRGAELLTPGGRAGLAGIPDGLGARPRLPG